MNNYALLHIQLLIILHFVADFVCQEEEWATTKHKSLKSLLYHCMTYSLWFILFGLPFILITFTTHFIIDFSSSKLYYKYYYMDRKFFIALGADQMLHISFLILTYFYFIN